MRVALVGPADVREELREILARAGVEISSERESAEAAVVVATQPPLIEALTPREIEVLELLADGLSNKAIAGLLGIADRTVKHHVAAICAKLGAENRTEAVSRGVRLGIVAL